MGELNATTPLAQAGLGDRPLSRGGLTVRERPLTLMLRLHALAGGVELNGWLSDSGVQLPTEPNRVVEGALTALWRRPTEWLLLGEGGGAGAIEDDLRRVLGSRPAAITDVSHVAARFRLTGARAWVLLGKHCGLDLDPLVFKSGACAQTRLAGVVALVYRHQQGIDVLVDRSIAGYLYARFEDSADHALSL